MPTKRQTAQGGTLAGEIQRKTAEIEDWPVWARPYEQVASKAGRAASPDGHGPNRPPQELGESELNGR